MTPEERIRAAREFIALADQFFGAGNSMVDAEMLWGAVTQIVIVIAMNRQEPIQDHQHCRATVRNLARELGAESIRRDFSEAQRLHAHFYHHDMPPELLNSAVAQTHTLINRLLPLTT